MSKYYVNESSVRRDYRRWYNFKHFSTHIFLNDLPKDITKLHKRQPNMCVCISLFCCFVDCHPSFMSSVLVNMFGFQEACVFSMFEKKHKHIVHDMYFFYNLNYTHKNYYSFISCQTKDRGYLL